MNKIRNITNLQGQKNFYQSYDRDDVIAEGFFFKK
jgi:hypothetical protein